MSSKSKQALTKQKKTFGLLTAAAIFATCAVSYFIIEDGSSNGRSTPLVAPPIDLPADKVNVQDIWMQKMESETTLQNQRLKYLEELVLDAKKAEDYKTKEAEGLKKELFGLKAALRESREMDVASSDPFYPSEGSPSPMSPRSRELQEVVMEDIPSEKVMHVDRAIPAGTTVKAILVSSVDASCGVNASSDPQPVKLRVIDDGHLPKSVMAKLKGSILIASAFGNISSERVYMRLERMTQVKSSGDFVETSVTGFVTGEDGKNGVRGVVADRSGQLVKSAAISGFMGGMSQFLQATINAQNVRDSTRGLPNNIRWDLIKEGSATGVSNAMDRLSEYYIYRAEQILPVIQVAAGRVVDITFTHGCEIGDLHTKDKVKEIREASRRQF